jgi:hypothetical protein
MDKHGMMDRMGKDWIHLTDQTRPDQTRAEHQMAGRVELGKETSGFIK